MPSAEYFLKHPDPLTRLVANGYASGAFLMDNGDGLEWYEVDNRALVPLTEQAGLHVARRLKRELKHFEVRINTAFSEVILGCRGELEGSPAREGQWISDELIDIYHQLHQTGLAHSFEVWKNGELAGGILGLALGGAFIAESKFHRISNASKAAVVYLGQHLQQQGFLFLDAQIQNDHLQTLGVYEVENKVYKDLLAEALLLDVGLLIT